jgi:NMD protein affecting ribosome stability and mRNA decay
MSVGACPECAVWVHDLDEVAVPNSDLAHCPTCDAYSSLTKWDTTSWQGDVDVGPTICSDSYAGICPKCSAPVPDITDLEHKWRFGIVLMCPVCNAYSRQSMWEELSLMAGDFDANLAEIADTSDDPDLFERLAEHQDYPSLFTESEFES